MKKIIYNNGKDVEFAYRTSETKFGKNKVLNDRKLSLTYINRYGIDKGKSEHFEFDLDSYTDLYGKIEDKTQWFSLFERIGEVIPVERDEALEIAKAIENFEIHLHLEDYVSNKDFADEFMRLYDANNW